MMFDFQFAIFNFIITQSMPAGPPVLDGVETGNEKESRTTA